MNDAKSTRFNLKQWLIFIAIGSVNFSSSICISLQAPFYPAEAEAKGATASEYGLVFGSYELTGFLSSPVFGRFIDSIGTRCLLTTGLLVNAMTTTLFGLLHYVNAHNLFIIFSFLLRILGSLGCTASIVANFSLTAAIFPDSIATTFAALEVFYGLGFILGPTAGGFLYSVGGFTLPFYVIGGITAVNGIALLMIIPQMGRKPDEKKPSMVKLVKLPGILLNFGCACTGAISVGYYTAILEPHLRVFHMSTIAIGCMFIINGGTYALVAPLMGRICDKYADPKKVMMWGCAFTTLSFILVGPLPYSGIPKSLPIIIIGLMIHGFGLACNIVPSFVDMLRSAKEAGFPDELSTYGQVSGVWSSAFALGAFIGPSVAGFLYDIVGFQNGTLFVILTQALLFLILICFVYLKSTARQGFQVSS